MKSVCFTLNKFETLNGKLFYPNDLEGMDARLHCSLSRLRKFKLHLIY